MKSARSTNSATSPDASPENRIEVDPGWRFAVVWSTYHREVTERLAAGARERLIRAGLPSEHVELLPVPGAWELPLAASWAAQSGRFSGVIALGLVVKGETSHDQHINRFVSMSLGQIGLQHQLPLGFGLLTCDTLSQAVQRAGGKFGNKGEEAADAVLAMLDLKRKI